MSIPPILKRYWSVILICAVLYVYIFSKKFGIFVAMLGGLILGLIIRGILSQPKP